MTIGLWDAVLVYRASELPELAVRHRVTVEDMQAWTPGGMKSLEAGRPAFFRVRPPVVRSEAAVAGRGQLVAVSGAAPAPSTPAARPAPSPAPHAMSAFVERCTKAFRG